MTTKPESGDLNPETRPVESMTAQQLDELVHLLLARRLVDALRGKDSTTPGVLQAAMRFLVDNGVTGLDVPGSAIEQVKKEFAEKAPFKLKRA